MTVQRPVWVKYRVMLSDVRVGKGQRAESGHDNKKLTGEREERRGQCDGTELC